MVICRCGLPSVLRTSHTQANHGRRFHCCPIRVIFQFYSYPFHPTICPCC
ncbi:putative Zinc finger, GRF-type [Helianthus anomalus]